MVSAVGFSLEKLFKQFDLPILKDEKQGALLAAEINRAGQNSLLFSISTKNTAYLF
jgi:hypothetical protein